MISSLKRDSTAVTFSFFACLLPLVIMLKTSSTLCAFLALLTGPPVLNCFLLHSEADVDHSNTHSLQLNLTRVLVQTDPLACAARHCSLHHGKKSCCHR